jgi:hypothetical protein
VQKIAVGDILLCYMARQSRWFAALEVVSKAFSDETRTDDVHPCRLATKPLIIVEPSRGIPAKETQSKLKLFSGVKNIGLVLRTAPRIIDKEDGDFLMGELGRLTSSEPPPTSGERELIHVNDRHLVDRTSMPPTENIPSRKRKLAAIIVPCVIAIIVAIVLITLKPWELTYALSVSVDPPEAGSVSPEGGKYSPRVQVTLTASPASGYSFDHWSGGASGTTSDILITMDSDKSLTAHFKTAPTVPEVLFSDDFSDEAGVWDTFSNEDGSVFYKDGQLHMINQTLAPLDTITRAHQYFTDFILEVETELVSGTDDNWHIIACRYEDDANYYDLDISADGYYSISKWVDGNLIDLLSPTQSPYINSDMGAINLVHIECIGSSLSLSVNGHLLGEVTDTTFGGGDIALGASSMEASFTEIAFDNITVSEP